MRNKPFPVCLTRMINRNMGCIEIQSAVHTWHRSVPINRNMGCIEIVGSASSLIACYKINRNMGCIEMDLADMVAGGEA